MSDITKSDPDFCVSWKEPSREFETHIYCDAPVHNNVHFLNEEMREPLVILQTANARVTVSELTWTEPTTITLKSDRPGFCMMLSASPGTSIQFGYENGRNQSMVPGHVLFVVPGWSVNSENSAGMLRSVMCSFDSDYAESILGSLNNLSHEQLSAALNFKNSLITSLLLRLAQEVLHPGPISEALAESFGNAILSETAHWLLTENAPSSSQRKLTLRHFAIIEEYLGDLTGKPPSVEAIAKACGFKERYFVKIFREETNCSVAQHIKFVQISKAKAYLTDSDIPLKEIAYRLGYSSPAHFSSAFRAATGKTPGQTRRQP